MPNKLSVEDAEKIRSMKVGDSMTVGSLLPNLTLEGVKATLSETTVKGDKIENVFDLSWLGLPMGKATATLKSGSSQEVAYRRQG